MHETVPPAGAPEAPALSPFERVVNTYIEPSRTFADIRRNHSWWLPFVLLSVFGWIFCAVAVQHVGMDTMVTNVLHSQPKSAAQLDKATPEEAARMISFTAGIMKGFFYGVPVTILVANAIFGLLLWFGFVFLLGGRASFGEMFAVSIFAGLPSLLGSILSIVTVLVANPQGYNINLPSPAVLGYFLGSDAPHWLVVLSSSVNLFTLWSLVLAGLGGAIVARVKPARGLLLVLGVWVLFVAVKTGIAAM